jgi:FkbM family methyltransferase
MANRQGCSEYLIYPHALGDGEPATLHACRDPRVSSLLPVNRNLVDGFPRPERFDVISKIPIQTSTLDSLNLPQTDFIKLDVQGAELKILQNATNALSGCIGLEVEIEFAPIYAGQPLFGDVCQFLVDQGFIFIDFTSLNRWGKIIYDGTGRLMFGDALFLRPYDIDAQDTLSTGYLERFVAICALYGRFDVADAALEHVDASSLSASSIQAYYQLRESFNRAAGISRFLGGSFTRALGIDRNLHFLP